MAKMIQVRNVPDPLHRILKARATMAGMSLCDEPVKELLNPVTHEIGQLIGDLGSIVRFYTTENLKKIFVKWAKNRQQENGGAHGKVIEALEFERVLPLLPAASLQGNEDLQERWARLLQSAATADLNYLPGFAQTLEQITSEEAQFLERLMQVVSKPIPWVLDHPIELQQLNESNLLEIYDARLRANLGTAERQIFRDSLNTEQIAEYDRVQHFKLMIEDLVRLGILNTLNPGEGLIQENRPVLVVNR